ncbi:MAG: hypothetical protein WB804_12445, partial [Candidatus Dormiibacterota bacterium]
MPPPTTTRTAAPTPATVATLAACGSAVTRSALTVIHHFTVSPDDIAIDSSGRLWVSAREAGQIIGLNQDGSGVTTTV